MREKIKTIFRFVLNNWVKFAEIGTVIWAVDGMLSEYRSCGILPLSGCDYHISPVLAYFFSAILIFYLLKKYERIA